MSKEIFREAFVHNSNPCATLASHFINTSLRSELLYGTNLETAQPRNYGTKINLASLGVTTWYKPIDLCT